jgi:hypothetical protein
MKPAEIYPAKSSASSLEIPREFLTPVNMIFGEMAPLAGMTREAIYSWRSRAEKAHLEADVASIVQILLEACSAAIWIGTERQSGWESSVAALA